MTTRLFIENREIELDETVQFAITKQFEDLSNPTTIINDWSKTVSIPFTARNNEIFGHIYNPDRLIVSGTSDTLTGIYFDPYKKLDMRLQWGDDVLMVGYAKMNEVKQNNGKGTYEITLFGELGKVFQEMKKITFDTTTDDTDYLIHGEKYVDEYLNKNLVGTCFNATQEDLTLYKKGDTNYKVTDIIGFAPNNSFSEGFDYKVFQPTPITSKAFTEVLDENNYEAATKIRPDTIIPDGMLPREIGEYRSYLQLPYIYWNKLWKIVQEKSEEITGYQFDLDTSWFTEANPYWSKLVFMLYGFSDRVKEEDRKKNLYNTLTDDMTWGITPTSEYKTSILKFRYDYSYETYKVLKQESTNISTRFITKDEYQIVINSQLPLRLRVSTYYKDGQIQTLRLNEDNALVITIRYRKADGNIKSSVNYLVCDEAFSGSTSNYFQVIRLEGDNRNLTTGSYICTKDIYLDIIQNFTKLEYGDEAYIEISARWLYSFYPFKTSSGETYQPSQTNYVCTLATYFIEGAYFNTDVILNSRHSNSRITLNTLWNNDYSPFTVLLNYCKMFRIFIETDEINKKIYFRRHSTYFSNYSVLDWTNKVDKSKDFNVKPITFTTKYVQFNYSDGKTDIEEKYKDKYGVGYGEYRLTTNYNFNNETTNLFDGKVPSSIVNTDNILSWNTLYNRQSFMYSFPSEISVYCKDEDKKYTSVFGRLYFCLGTRNFDTQPLLSLRDVIISDDNYFQIARNTYFYVQDAGNVVSTKKYPYLDVLYGNNLCLFNQPSENYTYLANYEDKNSIYSNFWIRYLNERYNLQNKIVTCYVRIKPTEFSAFKFNNFIRIGNQLYIVNKIYDYDITSSQPTKVDLITIQDVSAYTDSDYIVPSIELDKHSLTLPLYHFAKVNVSAIGGDWSVVSKSSDAFTITPMNGEAGQTELLVGLINSQYIHESFADFGLYVDGEVVDTDTLTIKTGSVTSSSITLSSYDIYVNAGETANVNLTSTSSWDLLKTENDQGCILSISPTSASSSSTITISAYTDSPTGTVYYYFTNSAGDITRLQVTVNRVEPVEGTLVFVKWDDRTWLNNITRGNSTTCTIRNDGTTWNVTSSSSEEGVIASISPVTGGSGTQTLRFSTDKTSAIGDYTVNLKNNLGSTLQLTVHITN